MDRVGPARVYRLKPEEATKRGMITIAGAKGGCGKTTVTLGLAKAIAGGGTPALAVDADRQLPDLHTTADVDREPTIAALDGETDVSSVAKQVPGVPGVGVIPAQRSEETVDLQATLEQLDYETAEVLVDSPSGAGPDVVEPLSAADAVVVVTTGTERSLESARTTLDIAERLGVPVAGVVFNRCETVPRELAAELTVDVLGAVPEREEPLTDGDVMEAFEHVASGLNVATGLASGGDYVPDRPDRLATGIAGFDRLLGGGVPRGSVVALEAPAASQAELLLHNLTSTRGTLYLTTERSEAAVRDALEASPVETESPTIRRLDGGAPLGKAIQLIENLPEGANLIVDAVDPLEHSERADYVDFLNAVAAQTRESEGLTMLHCLDSPAQPDQRALTEQFADVVVKFLPDPEGTDEGEYGLNLSKFRAESHPRRVATVSFSESIPIERPEFAAPAESEAR